MRSFLLSSAVNWIETYHMDGLRVDAVTAMLHLDFGRSRWLANRDGGNVDGDAVKMFQQLNKYLRANYPGVIIAAEESTAWPGVTHPPREGGLGFTHKWNMGWMHDTLDYMSLPPERRGEQHNKLTFSMMYAFDERYVLPLSHDEVVHGKLSLIGRMPGTYEQKFAQLRAMLAFMYAHPGAKLTFMGGKFGQFIEWDEKRPLDHFLLDYPQHHGMQRFTRALNRVYRSTPALWKRERDWSGFRWLQADDSANSVYAFLRIGGGQTVLVAANFSGNMQDHYRLPMPGPGTITEILGTDLAEFGGTDRYCDGPVTVEHVPFDGSEWSVWVHLPPLSVTYYAYHSRIKEELT